MFSSEDDKLTEDSLKRYLSGKHLETVRVHETDEGSISVKMKHSKETEQTKDVKLKSGPVIYKNGTKITLVKKQDLGQQKADVIVCSTNGMMTSPTGKSIVKVAGEEILGEIQQKCSDGIQHGDIAVIKGYKLQCTEVYLAALPGWSTGGEKVIQKCVNTCLIQASKYKSIVFPALGTGNLHYPRELVAEVMFQCIQKFDQNNSSLKDIKLLCYDTDTIKAFEKEESKMMNQGYHPPAEDDKLTEDSLKRYLSGKHLETVRVHETDEGSISVKMKNAENTEQTKDVKLKSGPVIYKNGTKITLVKKQDLGQQKADVIVCSTNGMMTSPTGKSIVKVAGEEILGEIQQKFSDGIQHGDIAVIKGYKLQCTEVYLAALPGWSTGGEKVIQKCVNTCLIQASKYKSIVFPALGTGNLHYPRELVAEVMFQCIQKFDQNNSSLKDIKLLCYDTDTIKAFEKEESKMMNQGYHPPAEIFQQPSVKLKHILANDSTYESFDMRVMVVGKYGVGKTTLVKVLVGDHIPKERLPTDGILLLEGRCGLDIGSREWILIDKDDYNAKDIVYNRMLMPPTQKDTNEESAAEQQSDNSDDSLSREVAESFKTTEPKAITQKITHAKTTSEIDVEVGASSPPPTPPIVRGITQSKIKTKLSKVEFKKRLELALENGTYKIMVGRLVFWDFGGQLVYYTTHQTFLTYRALYLVVFDGSKDLHEYEHDKDIIPGQHGKPTPAVFLQHWVNSILTYCQQIFGSIPRILFVATNKDRIPKERIEERRTIVFDNVDQLFKEHECRNHLVLEHRIFVNATDKNDPEIESLKKVITDLTFSHPCWGERMPNTWVPLELEIAELVAEGKQIISMIQLDELNKASEVSVLSPKDLKAFLLIQHSLGKIVYFDNPQLRDYVIISPLYMVEVMKSFVTDEHFWPSDRNGKATFEKMSSQGIIKKSDLFSLWNRKEFSKILPYKEFIFDMLVHLDILSEQRRYDLTTGIRLPVKDYFVPCMVVRINKTDYMEQELIHGRAIGLAFVFKGTVVPPALPNRLISACLNIWALKSYKGEQMIFSGLVVLSYDKSHEVVICVENNRILLFIVHKRSRDLIVPYVATSVRECMHTSLERISDFYQRSISGKSSSEQLPFNVHHACSELKCYLPKTDVLNNKVLVCGGHGNKYDIDVWYEEKNKEVCSLHCEGMSDDALIRIPSDPELLRLSKQFQTTVLHELALNLGITEQEWENVNENHLYISIEWVKFLVLNKWKEKKSGKFKDIVKALTKIEMNTHTLCQVRRIKTIEHGEGIPEEYTGSVPTDELLDALAPVVGKAAFELGIELGLSVCELEVIQYNHKGDLVVQTRAILQRWRNDRNIKATFGVLQQALVNVDKGSLYLESIIQEIGVKNHEFTHRDDHSDSGKKAAYWERSQESKYQIQMSVGETEKSETPQSGVKTSTQPVTDTDDFDISEAPVPVFW